MPVLEMRNLLKTCAELYVFFHPTAKEPRERCLLAKRRWGNEKRGQRLSSELVFRRRLLMLDVFDELLEVLQIDAAQ